jgi:Flavin containing amine oxidoreductase
VSHYSQAAVRWYASVLRTQEPSAASAPDLVDVGDHRRSTDLSVDRAVGNVIASQLFEEFQKLTVDERRMLLWNLKNVEYALGANMSDLSMKFWDIDERHAFEGDHVILRQGYGVIVEHLLKELQRRGNRFQYHTDFAVDKIEYNRKTTSQKYASESRSHQYVDLSDTCCVSSRSGSRIGCDMVVCCVPLGVSPSKSGSVLCVCTTLTLNSGTSAQVLKEAVQDEVSIDSSATLNKINFQPPLPFSKVSANAGHA